MKSQARESHWKKIQIGCAKNTNKETTCLLQKLLGPQGHRYHGLSLKQTNSPWSTSIQSQSSLSFPASFPSPNQREKSDQTTALLLLLQTWICPTCPEARCNSTEENTKQRTIISCYSQNQNTEGTKAIAHKQVVPQIIALTLLCNFPFHLRQHFLHQ